MDFEELMSQTGVKIIDKDINNKTISKKEKKKKKSLINEENIIQEELGNNLTNQEFENAIKKFANDDLFKDKNPKKKENSEEVAFIEHISMAEEVDHEIDLHGLTLEEAINKVENTIIYSVKDGLKKILIITGKGKHSKGGEPILRVGIKRFLLSLTDKVSLVEYAPKTYGGEGAFLVTLK